MKAVEIDERRVEYYDVGRGPTLVMVHGGMCSAQDYEKILPRLSQHYRCILPDMLMCGEMYGARPWDIWLLLDHLGIHRAAIMGHSQGGNFIRDMYCLAPERVWAWVNIDCSAPGTKIRAFKLRTSRFPPEMRAEIEQNNVNNPKGPWFEWAPYMSEEGKEAMRRHLRSKARHDRGESWFHENRPLPPAEAIASRPAPEPMERIGRYIRCPLLTMNSGYGRLRQENIHARWVQKYINAENVEYVVFTNSGHWIWLDQTKDFLRVTETFLAKHVPR